MDVIDLDKFKEAGGLAPTRRKILGKRVYSDKEMESMLSEFQNPIKAQKEMVLKIKIFLDAKIKDEMEVKGVLSDSTKRWVDSYTSMLEKLQKAIHGDKSVNINVHAVTHGEIAKKIREAI